MTFSGALILTICLSAFISLSCANAKAPPSTSSAGALTANTALNPVPARPFARHHLNAGGAGYLNEFIRPDVRARLDEEPVGDTDGSYDPATSDLGKTGDQSSIETVGESSAEETQQELTSLGENEAYPNGFRLDTLKLSWAKKAFGEAVKASPTNNGVIVLYADENYYDVERLVGLIEAGRNRIAEMSAIGGERIQVVFGGYRAVPQVELWVVPNGSPMPEFKTDDRSKPIQSEH